MQIIDYLFNLLRVSILLEHKNMLYAVYTLVYDTNISTKFIKYIYINVHTIYIYIYKLSQNIYIIDQSNPMKYIYIYIYCMYMKLMVY